MLSTMLSSSGKCKPYHSLIRELRALIILSVSSSVLIAWVICKSGLWETSETLDEERSIAKSLSFDIASFSSIAKPTVWRNLGLEDWMLEHASSSINWTLIDFFLRIERSAWSLTSIPLSTFARNFANSLNLDSPFFTKI